MSAPVSTDYAQPASISGSAPVKPAVSAIANQVSQAKDEANGAVVHQLGDGTPAEKAAQVLKGAPTLSAIDTSALPGLRGAELDKFQANGGAALKTDVVSSTKPLPVPTVGLKEIVAAQAANDAVAAQASANEHAADLKDAAAPPGALPDPTVAPREIPAWFKIGWSGQHPEDPFATVTEIQDRALLDEFISESYYGSWFHNAGIIVFAVVASHFVTLFGGGLASLIVILAISTTYYQTSIHRTRRNARDDMAREVAKTGLKTDVESATWLNLFMTRFWIIYEPVLSATIVASVDQVLSVSTPAFLNSIRMTTFTLGTKPPHIDHVRTFPDTEEDIVIMEWKISFTPNDIADMTTRQALRKVNPKIVLTIKLGVGPAVVGKDIVVEDLAFTGTMRIKMKLMNNFPHVQLVDLSFMGPPVFDFVLKPVGFDLSIIPGLTPFITSQLHATMGPMMYDPNVFTLNLEQMLSGAPLDTACGVLVVTIHSGRGIKGVKLGGGTPDPYVSLSISQRAELAKTSVKRSTSNPNWVGETKYLLLNNLNEVLSFTFKDYNEHRKDNELGVANFDLKTLQEDGQQEGITAPVMLDGKAHGEVRFDAVYYPVLVPKKLADGTEDIIPETKAGVVRLVIHQAKDLAARDKQMDPYAKVSLNDVAVHTSQTLKRTPNPVWERPAEFLVTDRASAVIGVAVWDDNGMTPDTLLGYVKVKLSDLLAANAKEQDWFPLNGAKSGRVRLSAEWKPVLMIGSINGAGSYTAPIGVLRFHFKRARDLKNVEALTGGKSDPYVRVLRSGIVTGRTLAINNNLDPEWDEIVYIQVHSPKDTFTLEVMDYQNLTKDRSLGTTEFSAASLIKEGEDKKNAPWLPTGKVDRKEMLRSDGKKTVKGSVEFEVEFIPAVHLRNVSFDELKEDTIVEESEESSRVSTPTNDTRPAINGAVNGSPASLSTNGTANGSTAAPASPLMVAARISDLAAKAKLEASSGVVIPRAELLQAQSGILAFQILSGELTRKGARLEVAFNSGYWPAYSTEPSRSTKCKWDEIGEFMITELDFATVSLKLNTAEKETREDIVASYTGDLNEFLELCLDKPATFTLTDAQGGSRNTVRICCKYIPVPMVLDPRESVNNSGIIRVDLLDAKDLPSADRSGKSDPFAIFELNGAKVHKSEVVKKNLNPTWNEVFETEVPSRVAAKFFLDVYDWDRVGADTKLGRGQINLSDLEPFEQVERTVALTDSSTGKAHGHVRVKILFRPGFITHQRGATSTFSGIGGRALTGIGGGVLAVGGAGVGTIGKGIGGVGKGIGGVGKGIGGVGKSLLGGHKSSPLAAGSSSIVAGGALPPLPPVPSELASQVIPPAHTGSSTPPIAAGNLAITIVQLTGAAEPDEKKSVSVRAYGKTVEATHAQKGDVAVFNQTVTIKTTSDPCELDFTVLHKKTFGADKLLGTYVLQAWEHIDPASGMTRATVDGPLTGGPGQLQIMLEWTPSPTMEDDRASIAGSTAPSTRKSRIGGGSNRFSFAKASRERETSAGSSD